MAVPNGAPWEIRPKDAKRMKAQGRSVRHGESAGEFFVMVGRLWLIFIFVMRKGCVPSSSHATWAGETPQKNSNEFFRLSARRDGDLDASRSRPSPNAHLISPGHWTLKVGPVQCHLHPLSAT